MNKHLTYTQALEGYELYIQSRHLSEHTCADYFNTFRKFAEFLEADLPIDEITTKHIEAFLADQDELSNKTLLNYHTGLAALWTWCVKEGLVQDHILHKVDRPKPEKREVIPYTEADIRAMLNALTKSKTYFRPHNPTASHNLPNPERNRAILLLLLDTGLRASELCELTIHRFDMRNRRLSVVGKGSKERMVPFCARTGQAIWRYLSSRSKDSANDHLFVTEQGGELDRHDLRKNLERIGQRAGVENVHAHRFRHTFAINFLRNGGDPYALQRLLGHSTMEMVKRYLNIAQADLDRNHKIASPVDNWRL